RRCIAPRRCEGAPPGRSRLRRKSRRQRHLATNKPLATTRRRECDARPARSPWPPRIPASGRRLSSLTHQIDALEQPDRDDAAVAALSPDPVVDDNSRRWRPLVNRIAISLERERDHQKIACDVARWRVVGIDQLDPATPVAKEQASPIEIRAAAVDDG